MSEGWLFAEAVEQRAESHIAAWPAAEHSEAFGSEPGPHSAGICDAVQSSPIPDPVSDVMWRAEAACQSTSPDLFFPVGATGIALIEIAAAKFVCSHCTVRAHCLEYALVTNQEYGVWGGFSEEERRVLRRRRRQPASRAATASAGVASSDAGAG